MKILFKREQTSGKPGRVVFKLWGKIELESDEAEIVKRYRFDEAVLIFELQPNLMAKAAAIAGAVLFFSFPVFFWLFSASFSFLLALIAAGAAGWFFYDRYRETIFVRDLMHGRYFRCKSIVDLAKKEARLRSIVTALRQVMESAKHWGGTEAFPIAVLDPEEAKKLIVKL